MTNIVEEITVKSASLPSDLQHEVLDFVDFVSGKARHGKVNGTPFESVLGNNDTNLQDSLSADEWIVSLKKWAGQKRNVPDIPAEALRRENFYEDRF